MTPTAILLAHRAGVMLTNRPHKAIYRHRGHRDASLGVKPEKNPGSNRVQRFAWLEGWNWFHATKESAQ